MAHTLKGLAATLGAVAELVLGHRLDHLGLRRLFAEQGYATTSVQQIVTAAGVTKGAFFHHFRSKEALGIAAAAGFGAALALVVNSLFGLESLLSIPLGAFFFSMLAASMLFGLALMRHVNSQTIILAGIALLFLFQSLLSLLQFVSSPELNQQIVFWLFGSLMRTTWDSLTITFVITLVCSVLLYRDAWNLTCLRLGEARARSLGVNINALRIKTLVLVALMTATAISFVGIIGFIGLVAPHIGRMLIGEDQRFLIPLSALCGAAMLSMSSVISKSIVPGALFPIGIVTAIIGVPFFIWLILGRGRKHA